MKKINLLILLIAICCESTECNWKGGEILDFGEYCDGELRIKVFEKNNFLKYEVRGAKDDLLFQQDMNISVYQRWGLFLDKKKNLWVFSSDVGDSVWKRDSVNGQYRITLFYSRLGRDDVPPELFESSLKRFLKKYGAFK